MRISECSLLTFTVNRHVILWTRMLVLKLIFRLTSNFAFPWKIVCALWTSWAKVEDSCVIFCRPSYVISLWSGSISPSKMSKSTNVLSNSFSKRSNQRNMDTATAIFETACDVSTRETTALWESLRPVGIKSLDWTSNSRTKVLWPKLPSYRRPVSWGEARKTECEKINNNAARGSETTPVGKLKKDRSGIPVSGIPSDWSIFIGLVNTQAFLTQMRYPIWQR